MMFWAWRCRTILAAITLSWLTSGSACADAYADAPAIDCLMPAPFETADGQVWLIPAEADCFDLATDEDVWAI